MSLRLRALSAATILAAFAGWSPFAGAAASKVDQRADRVVEEWRAWADMIGVSSGRIAVLYQGEPVAAGRFGGASSNPVELASLSKAITAACLTRLIDEGRANWADTVGKWAPHVAAPLSTVALADLTTHSAGLSPDTTQGWMSSLRGAGAPAYNSLVDRIAKRPLDARQYRYNNENYGVLAIVIGAIAGVDYADACAQPGLTPSPRYGRFAAWGGWRGDLADYGRFHWRAFGSTDPTTQPSAVAFGPAIRYGTGMLWRSFGDGWNFWHFGALCFDDGDNFMTHAVLFTNGFGVVSQVAGCPKENWFASLDGAIVRGVFQ